MSKVTVTMDKMGRCGTIDLKDPLRPIYEWHTSAVHYFFTWVRSDGKLMRVPKGSATWERLTRALHMAGDQRMALLKAAIDKFGYCSPEHYKAIDDAPGTIEVDDGR